MSPLITRVPAGLRAGGQFTAHTHAEPQVSLGKSFSDDMLRQLTNRREDEGDAYIDLTEYQLAAVRDHIDQTGDFTHAGVRKAAEEAYLLENRFTPEEYRDFVATRGDNSAYFGDPNALRRDIEQMRKDQAPATEGFQP